MFTAALLMKAKKKKQLKSLSTDEWTNKIWWVHTTEALSVYKTE